MREIKFRAWDKARTGAFNSIIEQDDMTYLEFFTLLNSYKKEYGCDFDLMQYTGLKDKNGVEIYEGDLFRHTAMYPVDFQKKNPGKKYRRISNGLKFSEKYGSFLIDDTYDLPVFCADFDLKDWEHCGNIYENPELLRVERSSEKHAIQGKEGITLEQARREERERACNILEKLKSNQTIDNGHDCYEKFCDYCENSIKDYILDKAITAIKEGSL